MKLFYYKDRIGNFGDDINEWIWEELIPGVWDNDPSLMVSGIGTILGSRMPPSPHWIVMGSGVGYDNLPIDLPIAQWNVICVRGPLTAAVLGIDEARAVTDSAMLLALLPPFQPAPESQRHGVVFMPHHKKCHRFGRWKEACDRAGIEFLSPASDAKSLIERIRYADLVLADAMHAAIVADTVRVPWIPLTISCQTNSFKWLDWTLSIDLPYVPVKLVTSSALEWIAGKANPLFGQSHTFDDLTPAGAESYFRSSRNYRNGSLAALRKLSEKHGLRIFVRLLAMLDWVLRLPLIGGLRQRYDDRQVERAAAALRYAVSTSPFLSRQDVFLQKKRRMAECLESLRALTAAHRL